MSERHRRFIWEHMQRRLAREGTDVNSNELHDSLWLEVVETVPALTRYELRLWRADVTVELNANDGQMFSWMLPRLAEGPGPALDPPAALRLAEAAAQLPPGAVLGFSGYEDIGGRQVFVAHWEHREDGVLIERDYIQVFVSGDSGRVYAVYTRWHVVDFTPSVR